MTPNPWLIKHDPSPWLDFSLPHSLVVGLSLPYSLFWLISISLSFVDNVAGYFEMLVFL